MQLGSATSKSLIDVSRPFAGEGKLARAASLESALIDEGQGVDAYQPSPSLAPVYQKQSRSATWAGAIIGAAVTTAFGVVCSASLGTFPLLLGLGAAGGAAIKWLAHRRHNQGEVKVDSGGQSRTEKFSVDPAQFPKSSADVRLIKTAQGELGDRIEVAPPPRHEALDSARLASLDGHRQTLMELGKERRLLADLGQQSSYGHDLLHVVDAATARKHFAAGGSVYLLHGKACEDVRHRYEAKAASQDGEVKHNQRHEVVERRFSYDLQPLNSADDLKEVRDAQGLPESMVGVYKNANLTPQIVQTSNQVRWARLDGNYTQRDQSGSQSSLDRSVPESAPLEAPKIPLTHGDVNAGVAFGFAGGILGVGLVALTGLPTGIALLPAAASGALGYHWMNGFLRRSQGLPTEG